MPYLSITTVREPIQATIAVLKSLMFSLDRERDLNSVVLTQNQFSEATKISMIAFLVYSGATMFPQKSV